MLPLFQRMSDTILSVLGEDAVFTPATGGTPTTVKVNMQFGVQLTGAATDDGAFAREYTMERDVATIPGAVDPQIGDGIQFVVAASGGTPDAPVGKLYRLEKRLRANGVNVQFIVLELL